MIHSQLCDIKETDERIEETHTHTHRKTERDLNTGENKTSLRAGPKIVRKIILHTRGSLGDGNIPVMSRRCNPGGPGAEFR